MYGIYFLLLNGNFRLFPWFFPRFHENIYVILEKENNY